MSKYTRLFCRENNLTRKSLSKEGMIDTDVSLSGFADQNEICFKNYTSLNLKKQFLCTKLKKS